MAIGRRLAADVLRKRNASLRRRAAALRLTAAGRDSLGVLVAEGDSWFAYPGRDVLAALEDLGYDVVSVAHRGDTVEDMAYADGQLTRFTSEIEKLLRDSRVPRAILLSGGGNDVAGDEFGMLVNHKASRSGGLNEDVVRGVIEDRVRGAYIAILAEVTRVCQVRTGRTIPIVIHGYDWPVPDGRGFLFGPFPGPWLDPGFRRKGFDRSRQVDFARIRRMAATLIDRFNDMLQGIAGLAGFEHVRYLNLRDTLSTGVDYRDWWANELHPTSRGFTAVAEKFARKIEQP